MRYVFDFVFLYLSLSLALSLSLSVNAVFVQRRTCTGASMQSTQTGERIDKRSIERQIDRSTIRCSELKSSMCVFITTQCQTKPVLPCMTVDMPFTKIRTRQSQVRPVQTMKKTTLI